MPKILGCYRTQDFSVVVVHNCTQLIFRTRIQIHYENVLIKCLLIPKKISKKNFQNFFWITYHLNRTFRCAGCADNCAGHTQFSANKSQKILLHKSIANDVT